MKRNPYVLAPFLAPYHATKGRSYYSAMLLAKYAAILASGSILFHVHACFSLQRAVVTALAPNGTTTAQLNFMSQEWWAGRLLLLALSVILQKLPIAVVSTIFRIDGVRGGGVSCEMCACMLSFLPRYRVSVFMIGVYRITTQVLTVHIFSARVPFSVSFSILHVTSSQLPSNLQESTKRASDDWASNFQVPRQTLVRCTKRFRRRALVNVGRMRMWIVYDYRCLDIQRCARNKYV